MASELNFEIRQQSEGVGGRLRIRLHSCPAVYLAKDGAVQARRPDPLSTLDRQEQSYVVEGCGSGRAYGFSVRACLPSGSSEFSALVSAALPAKAASLCSTAASVDTKGTEEVPHVVCPARVERVVEEVVEVPEKAVEGEAKSRFLPDEGCNLRKWLMDRQEYRPKYSIGDPFRSGYMWYFHAFSSIFHVFCFKKGCRRTTSRAGSVRRSRPSLQLRLPHKTRAI